MLINGFSRDEFLNERYSWRPGEHLVIISPTGGGKTYLMWQLLERAMEDYPSVRPVVLMPKPNDETTVEWSGRLGLRETPAWPPKKRFLDTDKPAGYVLWPPHATNVDSDERHMMISGQLRKGIDAQFWTPDTITVGDDAHSLAARSMYDLNGPIEEHLVNGRSNRSSIWLATQKPSGTIQSGGLTSFAYSSSTHMFLGQTPAEADIKKYSEIAGVDQHKVEQIVRGLQTFEGPKGPITQWLYINTRTGTACLVNP